MRLDRYLAACALGPRRERALLLAAGDVTVDGAVVTDPAFPVPDGASVLVRGAAATPVRSLVLAMHKPAGVLTATKDARDPTVLDLLPSAYRGLGLYPVGRLDKETEGLLLLTNDGAFATRLLKPPQPLSKTYYAEHYGTATEADVAVLAAGFTTRDGLVCAPAILTPLDAGRSLVTVTQGKRHQVRRMLWDRRLHVRYLRREAIGPVNLGDLPKGAVRELKNTEIEALVGSK
jgi:16S rRNA pseudouridine516 synthase